MSLYDENGNITREGAESVIRGGGSVSIKGRLYASIDKLPDEATFAAGDAKSEANAREKLAKVISDAQAQMQRLGPVGGVREVAGKKAKGKDAGPNVELPAPAGKS